MSHTAVKNDCRSQIHPFAGNLPPGSMHPAPKPMKSIEVSISTTSNNGKNVSADELQPIIDWVLDRFGGYTVCPHIDGGGDCGCPIPCRDAIHQIEITTEDGSALVTDLIELGSLIREHLDRITVLITASGVEALSFDTSELVESLTPREKEVLDLLVTEGLSNKKIAKRLHISRWTVDRHLTNIYGKLGVESRTEAVAWVNQQRAMQSRNT